MDMSITEAAESFTLVDGGRRACFPDSRHRIISVAAGIIATRNTDEDSLATQVGREFKIYPKSLYISGIVLLAFAAVPGTSDFAFCLYGRHPCRGRILDQAT